jgi:hypothetical protein
LIHQVIEIQLLLAWTIITPAQAIQQLIELIHDMGLNQGTQTSLIAPLNAALFQLGSSNNPNSGGTVCNQLNAFVNHVDADSQNAQLSSAQNIQKALGCAQNGIVTASSPSPLVTTSSLNQSRQSNEQKQQTPAPSTILMQPKSQSSPYQYRIPQLQSSLTQQAAPVANAGLSQTLYENTKVVLDGTRSYNPNPGGSVVSYQWVASYIADHGKTVSASWQGYVVDKKYPGKSTQFRNYVFTPLDAANTELAYN